MPLISMQNLQISVYNLIQIKLNRLMDCQASVHINNNSMFISFLFSLILALKRALITWLVKAQSTHFRLSSASDSSYLYSRLLLRFTWTQCLTLILFFCSCICLSKASKWINGAQIHSSVRNEIVKENPTRSLPGNTFYFTGLKCECIKASESHLSGTYQRILRLQSKRNFIYVTVRLQL